MLAPRPTGKAQSGAVSVLEEVTPSGGAKAGAASTGSVAVSTTGGAGAGCAAATTGVGRAVCVMAVCVAGVARDDALRGAASVAVRTSAAGAGTTGATPAGAETALGSGSTIVGMGIGARAGAAGSTVELRAGAGVVGRTTSCACTIAEESISMAAIVMVLRGDVELKCVMHRKRDEVRFGFHLGDEARVSCLRIEIRTIESRNRSKFSEQLFMDLACLRKYLPTPYRVWRFARAPIQQGFDFVLAHTYMPALSLASSKAVPCAGDGHGRKRRALPSDAKGCGPRLPLNGMLCAVRPFPVWWCHMLRVAEFRWFSGSLLRRGS